MYLGAEISAQDVVRGQIAQTIHLMRKAGTSDFEIRAYLLQPPAPGHPCRGPDGGQLCTTADIDDALIVADAIRKKELEMSAKPWLTWKTAAIMAVAAMGALVVLVPRKGK